MIPITDAKVRLLLLAELVRNPVGLTPTQAAELRGLTAAELVKLAEMPEPRLTVTLDGSIGMGLRRVEALQAHDEARTYFIINGASEAVMRRLFRFYGPQLGVEKKRLGAPSLRRPAMPKIREREAIQAWWWKRTAGKESIEDYKALHVEFPGWSIATLNAVVHEMDEEPVATEPKILRQGEKQ